MSNLKHEQPEQFRKNTIKRVYRTSIGFSSSIGVGLFSLVRLVPFFKEHSLPFFVAGGVLCILLVTKVAEMIFSLAFSDQEYPEVHLWLLAGISALIIMLFDTLHWFIP